MGEFHRDDEHGRPRTAPRIATTHLPRPADDRQDRLHRRPRPLRPRLQRHHVPLRPVPGDPTSLARPPDRGALLPDLPALRGIHHLRDRHLRRPYDVRVRAPLARDDLHGAVLGLLRHQLPHGRRAVLLPLQPPPVHDPGHGPVVDPAHLPLHAERHDRQLWGGVHGAAAGRACHRRRADGAGARHAGRAPHVRAVHSAAAAVRAAVAEHAARYVHQRGPAGVHGARAHRSRRRLSGWADVFRRPGDHAAGGQDHGDLHRGLSMVSRLLVLLHFHPGLSRRIEVHELPPELVGVCLSECRLHDRGNQDWRVVSE